MRISLLQELGKGDRTEPSGPSSSTDLHRNGHRVFTHLPEGPAPLLTREDLLMTADGLQGQGAEGARRSLQQWGMVTPVVPNPYLTAPVTTM